MKMVAKLTVIKQPNVKSRDMRQQKIIKGSFFKSMVQCQMAFQDLTNKGIQLCKLEGIEVTREEGKKTTTVGDIGVAMEGVMAEC